MRKEAIKPGFVATVLILFHCIPINSYPGSLDAFSGLPTRSLLRRDDPTDPEDFSAITGFAGLGDSFAAGIGGPSYDNDTTCARGDTGYPSLINQDGRMGDPAGRTFQFLACSGATTKDIVKNQIPVMGGNQQLITLSAGGNDVGLSKILDACIFGWSPIPADCNTTIANSQKIIENELSGSLKDLYSAAKAKLGTDPKNPGKMYVTGYGKFFDANTTQCNSKTWSFWYQQLNKQYLTQELRRTLNDMVDAVNSKIADAVAAAGDQVVFVNWDQYFTRYQGRYCESNALEPNGNRLGLLFYEWDTIDNGEPAANDPNTELKRSGTTVGEGSFGGEINDFVEQTVKAHPEWTYATPGGPNDEATLIRPPSNPVTNGTGGGCQVGKGPLAHVCTGDIEEQLGVIQSYLPVTWLRVFHPRPPGQAMIANLVLYYMYVDRAKLLSQQAGPEISSMTVCPNAAVSSAVTSPTPSVEVSEGLTCRSPSTIACATFNAKRDAPPATVTATVLGKRQGPGLVPFGSVPNNTLPASIPTGPATTCSCTA